MSALDQYLHQKLDERKRNQNLRALSAPDSSLIDFTSNDYLGLARSPELFDSITSRLEQLRLNQNGATGSRLLSGNSVYQEEVERKLAGIFKSEASLILNSGYSANLAALSALPQRGDTILYDELSHASIKDGARLSLAKRFGFRHNDVNDLEKKLKSSEGRIYIVVESVYSMNGDVCPLKDLVSLAQQYGASIILDEAHSTGVLGEYGNGLACSQGLHDQIDVRIYTFGKAMGVHGACISGSEKLRQYLTNFARPFIYTTALPPHSIAAIDCAFEFLSLNADLQEHLRKRISLYQQLTSSSNEESSTAIQTVIIPGNQQVKEAARQLQQNGFDIRPILSPTVSAGGERLRICLHSCNTMEEITNLSMALKMIRRDP